METLVLNVETVDFTDAQFDALCQTNKDWKFTGSPGCHRQIENCTTD